MSAEELVDDGVEIPFVPLKQHKVDALCEYLRQLVEDDYRLPAGTRNNYLQISAKQSLGPTSGIQPVDVELAPFRVDKGVHGLHYCLECGVRFEHAIFTGTTQACPLLQVTNDMLSTHAIGAVSEIPSAHFRGQYAVISCHEINLRCGKRGNYIVLTDEGIVTQHGIVRAN